MDMKNRFFLFAALACGILFTSCKKATFLETDVDHINSNIKGTSGTVTMHSDVASFSVEHAPTWMEVEIVDSILNYKIAPNETKKGRIDSLVISAPGKSITIAVKQGGEASHLKCAETSIKFDMNGGEKKVKIDTDGDSVHVEAEKSDFDAIVSDDVLIVKAKANYAIPIKAKLVLKCDKQTCSIDVHQDGQLYSLADKMVNGLYGKYSSYGLLGQVKSSTKDKKINLEGVGRLVCIKLNKSSLSSKTVQAAMKEHYRGSSKVHDVYISNANYVVLDCRTRN